ncbi:MAG: AAA family ATPase [Subdoligranulum sp.]
MEEHLRENGVAAEQIVSMNFESMQYADMDSKALYQAVMERKLAGKRLYLFWMRFKRSPSGRMRSTPRIDLDCDIYVTGSNAFCSSELSTYLSGRYVEVKMLPSPCGIP